MSSPCFSVVFITVGPYPALTLTK